jgi:hypothetical protein
MIMTGIYMTLVSEYILINYNKTLSADLYALNKNTESQSIVRPLESFFSCYLIMTSICLGILVVIMKKKLFKDTPFLMAMAMATF